MNRKPQSVRLSIGATSIFMIFVILVMCVLAILSYLRADSYYESTLRQVSITNNYYQTESSILEKYYQITTDNLKQSISKYNINVVDDTYVLEEQINDYQILQLTFEKEDDGFKIVGLKTINQEE